MTATVINPATVTALLLMFHIGLGSTELNLPNARIRDWAQRFGSIITQISEEATALTDIRTSYLLANTRVEWVDGFRLVMQMRRKLEDMLQKKVQAVEKLVEVAEEAFPKHHERKDIKVDYPKSKKLNTTEVPLEENEHFNFIKVNLQRSTVHVPTNVYDESSEVLNGVEWSEVLDPYFQQNYLNDPTLTWQYFASASGFFRSYPGIKWNSAGVDMYDCRSRGWYIQAAASHKDIIILLDASGSMTGQRLEIAKATVEKLVDTLTDDDYFNIIKFSGQAEFIDECFNRTMVQATSDNKKRLKEHLADVKTENIANFDQALRMAFELMDDGGRGGDQCSRAIMVVTDGVPDTYEEIFNMYNWPDKDVHVRMFTYVIGQEVGESKQLRWMACANKGYYSHISTLADVQEHVQEYIHVLSRPMVIYRKHETIWANAYMDAAGLKMMTSVAQPVFDTRNESTYHGQLLGVIGTDVPISEITKLTPQYKLGVNGYAFAINNNGFVLFHPDFRPTAKKKGGLDVLKTNYNSVDLSEVELSVEEHKRDQLRRKMLDRELSSDEMEIKVHHDDMKRVTIRNYSYYFAGIQNTPFSLGIALPSGYGQHRVVGKTMLADADLDALLRFRGSLKLAPWHYCQMDTNETKQDQVEMLWKYLKYGQERKQIFKERCDVELIEGLLYDAATTRTALASWMKQNRDGSNNASVSRKNGIQVVFLGTKSGLTRYHSLVENLTNPDFIEKHSRTIEEEYYKRAADFQGFIFSVPFNAGEKLGFNHTMVTGSTAVRITDGERKTVAAVAGMQMEYNKFYDFFMNATNYCPPGALDCNFNCTGDELECYLLDNNGFVVLSKNQKEVGQFFGEIDATIMKRLIEHWESGSQKGVFQKVEMYDYQGLCDVVVRGASSAPGSIFIDPLRRLISGTSWFIKEIVVFLVEFNLFSWWSSSKWVSAAVPAPCEDIDMEYENLEELLSKVFHRLWDFGTGDQIMEWRNELVATDYSSAHVVLDWYDALCKQFGPRLVGYEECVQKFPLFRISQAGFFRSQIGSVECEMCSRAYALHPVDNTNLMLLVMDSECQCIMDPPISVEPVKVEYNSTMQCQRLQQQQEVYRIRPESCFASHPQEDSSRCGGCSRGPPSVVVILALLLAVSRLTTH